MSIRTVLVDLSGTLHVGSSAINDAVSALKRLRDSELIIKFVTNTTKESRRVLHERLLKIGFQISPDEIFTSLHAAKDFIKRKEFKRPMLLIDPAALEEFEDVIQPRGDETADAVVIGLSPSDFNYPALNAAFRHILNGATLVAVHKARYFKESDGLSLGPGPFVQGLEFAADCKAHVVGKPDPQFFQQALDGADSGTAVMIGDDVRDDIAGAQACGIRGILVKTGKYRDGDENKISPPPTMVCSDFTAAVEQILKLC